MTLAGKLIYRSQFVPRRRNAYIVVPIATLIGCQGLADAGPLFRLKRRERSATSASFHPIGLVGGRSSGAN